MIKRKGFFGGLLASLRSALFGKRKMEPGTVHVRVNPTNRINVTSKIIPNTK